MYTASVAFLFGALTNLIDDTVDMGIFPALRLPLQVLGLIFAVYLLYFNKPLAPIAGLTFGLGGIIAAIFAPDAVSAPIWKAIIAVAVPSFVYHVSTIYAYVTQLEDKSVRSLVYFVIPILVVATIFSIVEDRLVPGEYSSAKLIDKSLQTGVMTVFLLSLDSLADAAGLDAAQKNAMMWLAAGWLGYVACNVLTLLYWRYMHEELAEAPEKVNKSRRRKDSTERINVSPKIRKPTITDQ